MKTRKGFTLIELMIVIAIIAIIAAIAIPNLMQSRIRANEATSITAIKNYCAAQVQFQVGRHGASATVGVTQNTAPVENGYAREYPVLHYGFPSGRTTGARLGLISAAHADAYITAPTTATGGTNAPYQGYQFDNPADIPAATNNLQDFFALDFAQVAVPTNSDTTGNNIYWVGIQGTVFAQGAPQGKTKAADSNPTKTPSTDASAWRNL